MGRYVSSSREVCELKWGGMCAQVGRYVSSSGEVCELK